MEPVYISYAAAASIMVIGYFRFLWSIAISTLAAISRHPAVRAEYDKYGFFVHWDGVAYGTLGLLCLLYLPANI